MHSAGMLSPSRLSSRTGGVRVRILFVVITLIGVGVSISLLLRQQQSEHQSNSARALVISEYGLQLSLEKLQDSPSWQAGFPQTTYNKGSYTVTMTRQTTGDSVHLRIESVGRSGQESRLKVINLVLVVGDGDSMWLPTAVE
jgi:hypothetical protein